ncbi:hypothetical protein BP6252_12997 [Coleophoma cylindrospora]|uniref:Uncharacterized protein n=1 Tax=Coleophoma cylindrospora TaxID=1849047 RepID=A0A3D8QE22_9HELO|nr:hypothetical protein BP6252_12997 [Coleophoma cylindrospora]
MATPSMSTSDINIISEFLSHPQIQNLSAHDPVDVIVICVSAVFHSAEVLFRALEARPDLAKTLVLCGGIGHSTQLIYDAVARSPAYSQLTEDIKGLPESRVLEKILERFFDVEKIRSGGCKILIEDQSTNCGANARKTREVLEKNGLPVPKSCIVIQDPTMALRTVASFAKVYEDVDLAPDFFSCPGFVPQVRDSEQGFEYVMPDGGEIAGLWEMERFLNLIVGEIPRLRDDANGYGPMGTGFIVHVDIPDEILEAWGRVQQDTKASR